MTNVFSFVFGGWYRLAARCVCTVLLCSISLLGIAAWVPVGQASTIGGGGGGNNTSTGIFTSLAFGYYLPEDHYTYTVYPLPASTANGVTTVVYSNNSVAQQVTVTWNATTKEWLSMSMKTGNTVTDTWVDGTSQGYPGALIHSTGSYGGNFYFTTTEGIVAKYVPSGNRLEVELMNFSDYTGGYQPDVVNLQFNGKTYASYASGFDYRGFLMLGCQVGQDACKVRYNDAGLWQIGFPSVGSITYDYSPSANSYVVRAGASNPLANTLTRINGFTLQATATGSKLPLPAFNSFDWQYETYEVGMLHWVAGGLRWDYSIPGATGLNSTSAIASYVAPGTFEHLEASGGDFESESLSAGIQAGSYTTPSDSYGYPVGVAFTSFNGVPYTQVGNQLVPKGLVNSFSYAGSVYSYSNSAVGAGGNWVASYSGGNGKTATVEFKPSTGAFVKMVVKPTANTAATFVDGAGVGRPGAYVWSNASTASNLLTAVNGENYTPSGDMSAKTNAYVNNNGVFDINGNFLTLGLWSNDPNRVGFSLSYDDGIPTTVPASIDFVASRPSSQWTWNAATADNTGTTPMMQLDGSNRLSLYPANDQSGNAVPAPTVVLDPTNGGVSQFDGVVRFNKAIRVEPQGDLSMGDFTHDGFSTVP